MAELRRMRPLLGTFVEIGVEADNCPRDSQAAISHAFSAIENIERLLSFQRPDSELSRLNRAAGTALALTPLTMRVLRLARAMTRASAGLFNCTLGGSLIRAGVLPNHCAALPLPSGDADDIELRGNYARLRRPIQLSVDGIAKGFAVDLAVQVLRRAGFGSGWVNAGGDLRAFGNCAVPVQRREADGTLAPLGILSNGAIASSAAATVQDSRFPGLIMASDGGRPLPGTWSVYARRAWRADALTKVAALAPSAERAALIGRLGGQLLEPLRARPA